jgi:opacity protein-like surface antigen
MRKGAIALICGVILAALPVAVMAAPESGVGIGFKIGYGWPVYDDSFGMDQGEVGWDWGSEGYWEWLDKSNSVYHETGSYDTHQTWDHDWEAEGNFLAGIMFYYKMNPRFVIEIEVERLYADMDTTSEYTGAWRMDNGDWHRFDTHGGSGGDFYIMPVSANLNFNFLTDGPFIPYGIFGLTYYHGKIDALFHSDYTGIFEVMDNIITNDGKEIFNYSRKDFRSGDFEFEADQTINSWGFNLGFGADYWLNDHVAVTVALKYFWAQDETIKVDSGQWQDNVMNFDEIGLDVDMSFFEVSAGMKFFM